HAIAPAMLCLAAVTEAVADRIRKSGAGVWAAPATYAAVVAVLAAVQAPQLTRYYRVPKQPFRQAIARSVDLVGNDGVVLAVDQAQNGFRYYGAESGLDPARVRLIRTSEDF